MYQILSLKNDRVEIIVVKTINELYEEIIYKILHNEIIQVRRIENV